MAQIDPHPDKLVSKKIIAQRYGVSIRTVNSWMRRRILPHVKLSPKMVRFDIELCDIAIAGYEQKSIFDQTIREELARRLAERNGKPFAFQKELGIDPIHPPRGQTDGGLPEAKS